MKYKICDIHAHIAPAVDDGAVDFNMSIEMLRMAYNQGTRNIVCTSHSCSDMKQYIRNLQILQEKTKQENIGINLYTGCEIDCYSNNVEEVISGLNEGKILTINGSNYILVEFSPYSDANKIINFIHELHSYKYKIIIAHTERYLSLFTEDKWIPLLQKMGCLFQINAYSIYDERNVKIKSAARMLLKEKFVSFIGSDAHRTNHRPYMIKNGVDYIYENCDDEYAKDICYRNAERILNIK